ncbi:hypothetical protein [Ferrimicrobium acidiphilum]|uniref:hypothetical protein n=1 Tax=Ferrimicrobium acidiphilum TaxID=121039 RepID=UPI0023F054D0|nr:hypothetical protein [Ferrimicrobium acidiphilum]
MGCIRSWGTRLTLAGAMPIGTDAAAGVPPSGFQLSSRQTYIFIHDYKPQRREERTLLDQTKPH